jgi:hypothetical protein
LGSRHAGQAKLGPLVVPPLVVPPLVVPPPSPAGSSSHDNAEPQLVQKLSELVVTGLAQCGHWALDI